MDQFLDLDFRDIRNKKVCRVKIFRYGLPQDILSKRQRKSFKGLMHSIYIAIRTHPSLYSFTSRGSKKSLYYTGNRH